jgi:type I restriction enzyme S subunit
MNRWLTKPLGELISLEYGKALKAEERSDNGCYPVYGSNGIVGSYDEAVIKEPTIVVGRKGAIGEAHLAENGCWPIDTAFYTVFRQPGIVSLRYLLLWFHSVDLKSLAITATIPGLNRNTLYAQRVPLPPLAEQERIVKLLDEADELRKPRAQADRRTADLIPALFHQMFGELEENPKGWIVKKIGDIVSHDRFAIRMGPFGSQLKKHELVNEGIKVLWIENIVNGKFDSGENKCITQKKYEQLKGFSVKPSDILITTMGTIGRCGVVPDNIGTAIISSHLIKLTLNKNLVDPIFVQEIVKSDYAVGFYASYAHGAIMKGLNTTIVKSLPIPIPPIPLQKEFAQRATEIRELEAGQAASRSRLDDLFQSMLYRAFDGDL